MQVGRLTASRKRTKNRENVCVCVCEREREREGERTERQTHTGGGGRKGRREKRRITCYSCCLTSQCPATKVSLIWKLSA